MAPFLSSKHPAGTSDQTDADNVALFPSTRYQGSKRKVVPWLHRHLQQLDFSTALDVFGGTGTVSYLMKRMGKHVTYNDALRFNYHIGLALVENDDVVLSDAEIERLVAPVKDAQVGFVASTFRGYYFTHQENRFVDTVCARIEALSQLKNGAIKAALASNALYQACLVKRPFNLFHRKNLYLRLSTVERSFGNKRTWDRPFSAHIRDFAKEGNRFVFRGDRRCKALNVDALEVPKRRFDLVYVDPPYLAKRGIETADYRRCYHFLEGLAHYRAWGSLIDYSTINRRLSDDQENRWIDETRNVEAFDELFDRFSQSILVISYKKFGIPSLSTLVRMLRRHGRKRVTLHTRHYTYALNHQNGNAELNREALIVAT